ncbi:efflux RND transporter periplasmic adaptor subunit [Paenibacillus mucilaginosus]|uniref:Efflux transporter, RND family, MFP subunit n=1 Tax=Paenibacillus mucilaginosus (strain KNP414) TaxID=1036673 RepID=F8FLZ1_PAEMK|nr:efflux RND transporter periplasmic adaptor subunit [Paenibacillus mucilaginosus]AEI45617.1 efflux transporter, RND family, MFP subunit [Paenibacillus mucilaginosus KNP414]MCG7215362.1 efflux RND transporter periplasmic adaptor subunit [Paenibacillus mucilaginosus]WDM27022.1 efflux RND transporter periplasmic adaptor subunit [Paenibacillus mucilaginosus]
MNKKWVVGLVFTGILSYFAFDLWSGWQKKHSAAPLTVTITKAHKEAMYDTLVASGSLVPQKEEKIYLDTAAGVFNSLLVHEGQQVTPGTPLFNYMDKETVQRQIELELTEKKLLLQLDEQKEKMLSMEQDFKKQSMTLTADSTIDQLVETFKQQKKQIERAIETASIGLEENKVQQESLAAKSEQLIIKSTIAGVIQKINYSQTTSPADTKNEPFIHIVSKEPFQIKGSITEFDHVLVKEGQDAIIKAKVIPGKTWRGKVTRVDHIPTSSLTDENTNKDSVTFYPFTVALEQMDDELKYGYHVTVEFQVHSKPEALVIPKEALIVKDAGEYVYIINANRLVLREVQTGLTNEKWVEIRNGLSEQEQVITTPSPDWFEGMEVVSHDTSP